MPFSSRKPAQAAATKALDESQLNAVCGTAAAIHGRVGKRAT
jgi:hypothetical protein